jgi:hypothetical protein
MVYRSLFVIGLTAVICAAEAAPPVAEGPRQIQLAPQSTAKQVEAFHYRLLPDPRDRTPGNAAPLWRLASDAIHEAKHKMTPQEWEWGSIPLDKLPRKEVRGVLDHYTAALQLSRQAACREHCDWELPPQTFQSMQVYMPLAHIQRCREIANLLSIQFRLQLVEGRFDDAQETLQTGFALAQHLSQGDRLIELLVGIAIDTIMFNHVEEWIQTPGSPNLYWALTELPRPLGNMRHAVEYELNSLYRSFPGLHRLRKETLTAQEADSLANEVFGWPAKMLGAKAKDAGITDKWRAAMLQATMYPQARKRLLEWGRPVKEIDALPKSQVLLLWNAGQWDRARDDVLKALSVPIWQGQPLMKAALKEHRLADDVLLKLLIPAIEKNWQANVRRERQLAGLCGAEALRLYAAAHEGKPPAKWSDITAVPLPIDPLTGKGFDDFYKVSDGRGILEIMPHPPIVNVPSLGRRYELAPK